MISYIFFLLVTILKCLFVDDDELSFNYMSRTLPRKYMPINIDLKIIM